MSADADARPTDEPADQPVAGQKRALRARAQRNRVALSIDHHRLQRALAHLLRAPDTPAGWVVLFDALPGEPELGPLVDMVPERDFALTRTPEEGRILTLHPWSAMRELHRFGYSQPIATAPVIDDSEVGVVLVPGLAFDRSGGRLGFGAGYYDRMLDRLLGRRPDLCMVGVSDGFIVDEVPTDEHDVPMTHLASEAGAFALPLVPLANSVNRVD